MVAKLPYCIPLFIIYYISGGFLNTNTTLALKIVDSYQKFPLENKIFRRPHFYMVDSSSWYYYVRPLDNTAAYAP